MHCYGIQGAASLLLHNEITAALINSYSPLRLVWFMLAWFSWWTGHLRICILHFGPNLCHGSDDLVLGCVPSGG